MKKILVLLLLMVSTSVFAEWSAVGGNEKETTYVDMKTMKWNKNKNKLKMWSLVDFKTVQGKGNNTYLSAAIRDEYDCEEYTTRMLDYVMYKKNMRGGDIVDSQNNMTGEPTSIMPGTITDTYFSVICSAREFALKKYKR